MKVLYAFRKLALSALLASFLVGLVGMIKSSYVQGSICQRQPDYTCKYLLFDVGLIDYCDGYGCMKTRDFLKAGQDEWNTVTATLIIETIFKGALLYILFKRDIVEAKLASFVRPFRIVMVSFITLTLIFGSIALAYADMYMYLAVDKALRGVQRSFNVTEGESIKLMKISFGLSAGGFLLYCIIWAIEVYKARKAQVKGLDASSLPFETSGSAPTYVPMDSSAGVQAPLVQYGAGQQQTMQPMSQQHVSLVIDGQTVTALLIPSGVPAVGSSNVVSGPIVYFPNANNGSAPPAETSSSGPADMNADADVQPPSASQIPSGVPAVGSSNVVSGPIVYLPNANSGYAPPAETSSSAPALPARPSSQVSMYPPIGSTSFPA